MTSEMASVRAALEPRYRVLEELGRGGMARVYLAEDKGLGRLVAVKVLRAELGAILGATRFRREVDILRRLHHPNIVPLLDWGEAGSRFFYVMPFIAGDSLKARLAREGPLALDQALAIGRDMATAIDHAHAQDVLHRDIKPANVLLEPGRALLCDFGISRAIETAGSESFSSSGLVLGTPAYMSPEQAAGGEVDGRSDIYSLACVVYEMLAGEPPFTGASAQAIMGRKLEGRPRALRTVRQDVPGALEATLFLALEPVPEARPRTAGVVVAARG
jgi:eukaryotic-like serine/threonine-protein kinase